MSDPERLDSLIARQRRALAGAPAASQVASELVEAWRRAVGEQIAGNTAPARMAGDTLVVSCSSSTWAGELSMLEAVLVAALRDAAGAAAPERLRFVVGELPAEPSDPRPSAARRPPPAPSAAELRVAASLAGRIADPELRSALERALAASLARERAGRGPRDDGAD